MSSITDALKQAGFKAERSTAGGKRILKGVYKASFYDWAKMEDKGYGESIYAQFKVTEVLEGDETSSQFPEFSAYYGTSPDKVASKRNGLAKLINGLFSVGVEVSQDSDEALEQSLNDAKGTEVFISAWAKQPKKQDESGEWVDNTEADLRQDFTFMTEKNAAKKVKKKDGGDVPF